MGMEINAYQAAVRSSSPSSSSSFETEIVKNVLGIQDTSNELEEFITEALKEGSDLSEGTTKEEMLSKLGDLLWYISIVAWELGVRLDKVAWKSMLNNSYKGNSDA